MRKPRWVVFDYGEVISRRTAALPDLAARLGVDRSAFELSYWTERNGYDRGMSDVDYWQAVGDRLGIPVDNSLAAELADADHAGWLVVEPASLRLIEDLHARAVPLALLSNAPASFGDVVHKQPWAKYFRHLVFSGHMKIAKPDPAIWVALTRKLGAQPAECLFLDDRQVNIDGAREAGLPAELWSNADATRERLSELGLLNGG